MPIDQQTREEIEILRQHWRDQFTGAVPLPSQFATWLRLYSIDIVSEGFRAADRWLRRCGEKSQRDLIRYASACMRNIKEARELNNE